jgi:hypothetical protein
MSEADAPSAGFSDVGVERAIREVDLHVAGEVDGREADHRFSFPR